MLSSKKMKDEDDVEIDDMTGGSTFSLVSTLYSQAKAKSKEETC